MYVIKMCASCLHEFIIILIFLYFNDFSHDNIVLEIHYTSNSNKYDAIVASFSEKIIGVKHIELLQFSFSIYIYIYIYIYIICIYIYIHMCVP